MTVGAFLALFLICSKIILSFTFGLYAHADGALAAVCILILAVMCCLLTAVIQKLCPVAKGSGIPLAEAEARGMLKVKWLSAAASLIAGSLLAFLSGLPLGSEGPSVGFGALAGDGIGRAAKKSDGFRRYLITGGACAGLASAFNAPLTGMCFAFEETHRRFSPYILIVTLSTVIPSVIASQLLFYGFGQIEYLAELGVRAGACVLPFLAQKQVTTDSMVYICLAALACGICCAGLGIAFNKLALALGALFKKIKSDILRLLPAFLLAAVGGIIVPLSVGSGELTVDSVSSGATIGLIAALLVIRFVSTAVASGSGTTGGLFLPMIAIGALFGMLGAKACTACGIDPGYAPNIILLCVCAFFAASVRAPITAVALSIELTNSVTALLPCIIAIAAASVIAELTKTEPLYEQMLENLQRSVPQPGTAKNMTVVGTVTDDSAVANIRIRNILWPYNSLVTELDRNGVKIVPDGETTLLTGDEITVCAERVDPDEFTAMIKDYIRLKE